MRSYSSGLRNDLSQRLYYAINNSKCWHLDAWILRDIKTTELFLRVQTREGGRVLLTTFNYALIWAGDRYSARYCNDMPPDAALTPITIQDQPREVYDRLNELHWRTIYPMTLQRPDAYLYSSVALWYITAPSLLPVDNTMQNYSPYAENSNVLS